MVVLQLSITYIPFMNRIFGTTPLALRDWLWPMLLGVFVFVFVEIEKWVMRRLDRNRAPCEGDYAPCPRLGRKATAG